MLGYTEEDLNSALYGVRLALEALGDTPATYPKEDLKRIQGLAKDGLRVAQGLLNGLSAEGYFN